MAEKELTFDEANKLCIEALILLSHQSLERKRRRSSVTMSSPFLSSRVIFDSPRKTLSSEARRLSFDSPMPDFQLVSTKIPTDDVNTLSQKHSLKREPSLKNFIEVQGQNTDNSPQKQKTGELQCMIEGQYEAQGLKTPMKNELQTSGKLSETSQRSAPQYFEESCLKQLKRDLEIKSRGKICKTQEIEEETGRIIGYHLLCKSDPECPFHCFLRNTSQKTLNNEDVYELNSHCQEHLKGCFEDEQELTFLRLTKTVDSMEDSIRNLLRERDELRPKEILSRMAEQLGYSDYRFIYSGLGSKSYQKAAKKYFDNLVYRIKNPF